jgi:hypothetical protein
MFILNGLIVRFIIGPDDQRFADGERFIISRVTFREATGLEEGLAIRTTQALTVVTAMIVVARCSGSSTAPAPASRCGPIPTTRIWRCCRASTPSGWWRSPG